MPNIFRTQVVLIYLEWFRRNSLLKCVSQTKIAKKITKTPYFRGSMSFKVIDVCTTGKLVSCACYDKQEVCVYLPPFSRYEPIVVKLRFLRGYPSLMPSFEGNLLAQRHQITSLETRYTGLPYGENPESLSQLGLIRYRVVTPGHTDRQTEFP